MEYICNNGHPDCLCDVIINEETNIAVGIDEMWHGRRIADALGLGVPWTSASFAELMSSITQAHDIWLERNQSVGDGWNSENQNGMGVEDQVLRHTVINLLSTGMSMVDVPRHLDLDYQTIIRAMTHYNESVFWGWDEVDWLTAEAVIYDDFEHNGEEKLVKLLGGVSRSTVRSLANWYSVTVNCEGQRRLDTIKAAIRTGRPLRDIHEELTAQGVECNRDQLSAMRRNMIKRGELDAPTRHESSF